MYYFGFDLGDGESSVCWSRDLEAHEPAPVAVNGALSFISAVGTYEGRTVIGTHAAGNPDVEELRVCFKRRFLEDDPEVDLTIQRFAGGVLAALRQNPDLRDIVDDPAQCCFVLGCPAGWNADARERYRKIMQRAGMRNVRVTSESRAAFENTLRCKTNGIDKKLVRRSVLVIDIGSSTLDLAYVRNGEEHNVQTVGDVKLGGGLMDEMIVLHALKSMSDQKMAAELETFLSQNRGWHSRVMMVARSIKEQYFKNEAFYLAKNEELVKPVRVFCGDRLFPLTLRISPRIVEEYLISQPHQLLDGQSFESKLQNTLVTVHRRIRQEEEPALVILTGGPSRMSFFQQLCREEFAASRVIVSQEPEFDISRGLAYAGGVDENAARLLEEARAYTSGATLRDTVREHIPQLISSMADALSRGIMNDCALPLLRLWKKGEIDTLADFETRLTDAVEDYLLSARGRTAISDVSTPWVNSLLAGMQHDLDEMAKKYRVKLDLLRAEHVAVDTPSGGGVTINPADLFTELIQIVASTVAGVVAALLCGGSGLVLVAEGPIGLAVGAVVGVLASWLLLTRGEKYVREKIKELHIPAVARIMLPERAFSNSHQIRRIAESLEKSMNEDPGLISRLTEQVGAEIERCFARLLRENEFRIVA